MSTLQQVDGVVGVALLITIMANRSIALSGQVSVELAQAAGLRSAFGVASVFALVAVALTFFTRRFLPDEGDAHASDEQAGAYSEPAVEAI
ncbi:MAG: hypothetical protein WD273_03115 [Trueperaceae bacterium]